jgi:hypothetical protein
MVGPAAKREGVAHLRAVMGLSERRACALVNADRKMIRYQWLPVTRHICANCARAWPAHPPRGL